MRVLSSNLGCKDKRSWSIFDGVIDLFKASRAINTKTVFTALPRRRGAVDIAWASGTEDPGSNPARVEGFEGKTYQYQCFCV
jgi:hypothetical protein